MGRAHPGGQLRPRREVLHGLRHQALEGDGRGHPSSEVEACGRCARGGAMSDTPRIRYTPRPHQTPETELNALAAVYRFILDYHTKHKTVEPAPVPDGRDTRRSESMVAPRRWRT